MASSSATQQEQEIKLCELCELCEEDSIKWRCIDCNMCMCEKCKTFHIKVTVTSLHQIVTVGSEGAPLEDVESKIITDDMPCKDHPKKMTCLFCKSCDSLICPDCVSSSHKQHNFIPINSALNEKLDYLKGIHDKIDANLKCCESKISEVQNIKPKYNATFDKSLRNIKQKEQQHINAIRKYSKDLQQQIKIERSRVNNILSQAQQGVDKLKKELEAQRKEVDAILTSNQGSTFFKANVKITDLEFNSLPCQAEQFIPETESAKNIKELFGSLKKLSIPATSTTHALPEMDFEVLGTFATDLPYVGHVITFDEASAWINCYEKGIIRKVNFRDHQMTATQEVSVQAYDMALTPNNDLVLSMASGPHIKLLKSSGEIVTFLTVSPLIPYGIHVTKNNDIIVGVSEPADPYILTGQSQRALMVFSMYGQKKLIYRYNKDKKKLITFPSRITSNNNQDILVVDRTSEYTGKLVALNREGNLRWLYEGNSKINVTYKFDPRVAATTSIGHIVVSDYNSHALHVLSEGGEVLTSKDVSRIGVVWPWGLNIDSDDRIWLGCSESHDNSGVEYPAKLHIIELTS